MKFTKLIRTIVDNIIELKIKYMEKFRIYPDKRIKLGGVLYKPYTVGNLPPSFGFKVDAEEEKCGISNWFNHKGLTYIEE